MGGLFLLPLRVLTVVALPPLKRRCGSLWTVLFALQPEVALLHCRLLPPFIPDVSRKSINSWFDPAHFLALSAPPSVGLAEASVCVCVCVCVCVYVREREREGSGTIEPTLVAWAQGHP